MFKAVVNRIIRFLAYRLRVDNSIRLSPGFRIPPNCIINGARIAGHVSLDENCKILGGVVLRGRIAIGRFTSVIGPNTDIISHIHPVTIGSFCSIARNVSIQEYDHHIKTPSTYYFHQNVFGEDVAGDISSKGPIEIGHDVWIGTHCVILSGSKIGNGAVIAANSVVAGEIPPYSIAAGSPAKVLKFRFSDKQIIHLQSLKWWNWPIDKILANKRFFTSPLEDNLG